MPRQQRSDESLEELAGERGTCVRSGAILTRRLGTRSVCSAAASRVRYARRAGAGARAALSPQVKGGFQQQATASRSPDRPPPSSLRAVRIVMAANSTSARRAPKFGA